MKKILDICLTPDLIQHYDLNEKVVVIVDIFRATSTMVTALAQGIESIYPVATVEECKLLKEKGYLTMAERGGFKVDGFDLDNSPLTYLDLDLKGKKLAMTTSNGTLAISKSKTASEVIIGAFLNKNAVIEYLSKSEKDLIILCSGWRGRVNLEDTLFAGALAVELIDYYHFDNDACDIARSTYLLGQNNPKRFLYQATHYQRLVNMENEADIDFSLQENKYNILPVLRESEIVVA